MCWGLPKPCNGGSTFYSFVNEEKPVVEPSRTPRSDPRYPSPPPDAHEDLTRVYCQGILLLNLVGVVDNFQQKKHPTPTNTSEPSFEVL